MFDFYRIVLQFAGLEQMIMHLGIGALLVIGLAAAAWFSPILKKDFMWAAIAVAIFLFAEGWGIHDEAARCKAQAAVVQSRVDKVVKDTKSPAVRKQRDKWNRPDY